MRTDTKLKHQSHLFKVALQLAHVIGSTARTCLKTSWSDVDHVFCLCSYCECSPITITRSWGIYLGGHFPDSAAISQRPFKPITALLKPWKIYLDERWFLHQTLRLRLFYYGTSRVLPHSRTPKGLYGEASDGREIQAMECRCTWHFPAGDCVRRFESYFRNFFFILWERTAATPWCRLVHISPCTHHEASSF